MSNIRKTWKFASSVFPERRYQTILYEDGSMSCNCPAWITETHCRCCSSYTGHICKHVRLVQTGEADQIAISIIESGSVGETYCSVEELFPNADRHIRSFPRGYVVEGTGPHDVPIKAPVWAVADDPLAVPGCVMVLTRFLDGSPVAVRYRKSDVYKYVTEPWLK